MTYRFLPESSFLASEWTGAIGNSAPTNPPSHAGILAMPGLTWRSTNRARTLLNQILPEVTDIYGIALININAPCTLHIQNAHPVNVSIDPLTGLGGGFLSLAAPEAHHTVEIEFAANTPTLDGADYFKVGAVVLFGAPLTALDNAPLRPSPEEWETDEEEDLEERQQLLPPKTVVEWEARPQTQADFNRWSSLIYRRDLRDLILWVIPERTVMLARLEGDVERIDFSHTYDEWRLRWHVL